MSLGSIAKFAAPFVIDAAKNIGSRLLNYGKNQAIAYISNKLGDAGQQSTIPINTIANIKSQIKDTVGNVKDIQARVANLQRTVYNTAYNVPQLPVSRVYRRPPPNPLLSDDQDMESTRLKQQIRRNDYEMDED